MLGKHLVEKFGNNVKERERFNGEKEYYFEFPLTNTLNELTELTETCGYKLFSDRTVANNRYIVYTSEQETVYISYTFKLGCIRVFTQKETPFTGCNGKVICEEAGLVLMNMKYGDDCQVSHDNGLGLIVTLSDGSFIVYDGGYAVDADKLLAFLTENAPHGENPTVRAWVLTHTHKDHYGNFDFFVRNYSDKVEIQNIIACIVDDKYYSNGKVQDRYFSDILPELAQSKGIPVITPVSGQIYSFSGVRMEILHTAEDLYPLPVASENHSSTMTRLYFDGQNKTALIMGDLARSSVTFALTTWGNYLKSDILQIPHHGHSGATKELYYTVDPQTVLFPTSDEHYACRIKTNEAWNHYLINDIQVKEVFVADNKYRKIL